MQQITQFERPIDQLFIHEISIIQCLVANIPKLWPSIKLTYLRDDKLLVVMRSLESTENIKNTHLLTLCISLYIYKIGSRFSLAQHHTLLLLIVGFDVLNKTLLE